MRNAVVMTVGAIVAMGAAFAVAPAMSDGPANWQDNAANDSAYMLHEEDHPEYVQRQVDGDDRDVTVRDRRLGYEDGVADRDLRMAQTTTTTTRTTVIGEESIDVQARRLPNGAPVAVSGMVRTISGKHMMLQRGDQLVRVRLPGEIDAIERGDDATVFGRLANRGDDLSVRAEAVFVRTSLDEGHLFLSPSRLESVNKRNPGVSRATAERSLDYYRYNFTPL
ncbi:MAG: hypothetical protein AB7E79_15510 [Rhodospirillaceae bacterium]